MLLILYQNFLASHYILFFILIVLILLGLILINYNSNGRWFKVMSGPTNAAAAIVDGIANSFYGIESNISRSSQSFDNLTTTEPVWILGYKYNFCEELDEIKLDIKSRLWFSYRKGFSKIGGTGPSSDHGWGCMLRCGQMVMAQALIIKHLGRSWRWRNYESLDSVLEDQDIIEDDLYWRILWQFLDKKSSLYSIHQIAQMGASEGKPVGEWFGPNTIAQTLKKLAEFDEWNNFVIHVALDNLVIIDDIKTCFKCKKSNPNGTVRQTIWDGLLLFIPLRLGLSEVNPVYHQTLKNTFTIPHTLGMIGGKPNHALYFIGSVDQELIYLDPHTTQTAIDFETISSANLIKKFDDSSYHQENALRMRIEQLDPSIALCFYFNSENDFEEWCNLARRLLITEATQPLFELCQERLFHSSTSKHDFEYNQDSNDYDLGLIRPSRQKKSSSELVNEEDSNEEFEVLSYDNPFESPK